jgi:hypothetical protein
MPSNVDDDVDFLQALMDESPLFATVSVSRFLVHVVFTRFAARINATTEQQRR